MFFHSRHIKQKESFAFWLADKCLEADDEDVQVGKPMNDAEFIFALAGITMMVAAVRGLVWLFCGC